MLLCGYEWFKAAHGDAPPASTIPRAASPKAQREMLLAFFDYLEAKLDENGFFRPMTKKPGMRRNLRNIFHRMELTQQDVRTLWGAVVRLVEGPRVEVKTRKRGVRKRPGIEGRGQRNALRTVLWPESERSPAYLPGDAPARVIAAAGALSGAGDMAAAQAALLRLHELRRLHVVMVMMVVVMMMMMMMHRSGGRRLLAGARGRRGGFLGDGVSGHADGESGGGDESLDHGKAFLLSKGPRGSSSGVVAQFA